MKDFDDLMTVVGNHGRYQRWVLAGIIAPTSFFVGFTVNLMLFQLPVPDHWCHVPGRENTSLSPEAWKNLTIPRESSGLSSCFQYKVEWLEDAEEPLRIHNITQECESGWEHDSSEFQATMATTNEWFCEREDYSNHIYSLSTAGSTVGTVVLPVIADRYTGRRLMFYVALVIHMLFTLPTAWVSHYGIHLALRFFAGFAFEADFMMPYIIGLEFLAPDKRSTGAFVSFIAWTFGMCLTSLVSWLIPSWQYLAMISCLPAACGFLYWKYLPESPRWLLAQGRISECATILLQVARSNRKAVSRVQLEADLNILWTRQEKEVTLVEAYRYPRLRMRAIILFVMCGCVFMCYGVVFLGITVLESNFFLSHFVLSISELPSNALGWLWTQYLGRRFTCIATFLVTAVFCGAAPFCLEEKWVMLTIVAFIRLFCTQLIYIVFVQCTEIFPTPIRSTGFAWMIVFGLGAMISTPYVLHSGFGEAFPYWLLVVLMTICAFLGIYLPETIGLPLPQTFQDAEELGRGRPLTTWINHWNQHKYVAVSTEDPKHVELKRRT
ncbi:solute carrier family 22 member 7-like [Penaeus japonicus]|uniref:solute carrier family 22 member 7-like n=1 Tax=Penaeus japonicus TaxID=27405 RepID=UPI001C7130CA|nr:solute carrier family 22 member 7-like [Penaeus japonicus]